MKSLIIGWLVIVLFALTTFAEEGDDSATVNEERIEGKIDPSLMNQQTYRSIFAAKRREQVETADRILGLDDYAKQYKMVELLSNTLFTEIKNSKSKLEEAGYISGVSSFPNDQESLQAVGVVFEGIPFFGDVLLRLPDITKKVLKRHDKEWTPVLKWGMEFCENSTAIFNSHHKTQLHLMSQELGFVPEDPDYTNPFRGLHATNMDQILNEAKKQNKKKKKFAKGPKLRSTNRNEL